MTRYFVLSLLMTVAAFGLLYYVCVLRYDALPEQIPTHWNARFEVDGWTPKDKAWQAFSFAPCFMVFLMALGKVLPWISPKQFTVDAFRRTWDYTMMLVVAMLGYMHVAVIWGGLSTTAPKSLFMRVFLGGICLFFALIGNVLGKTKRNFWMGIRTPWTLASDTVWYHTHRLAAWLFVAAGVASFLLVMVIPASLIGWGLGVVLVGIFAAALIPVGYSLTLYKRLEREGKLDQAASPPDHGTVAG